MKSFLISLITMVSVLGIFYNPFWYFLILGISLYILFIVRMYVYATDQPGLVLLCCIVFPLVWMPLLCEDSSRIGVKHDVKNIWKLIFKNKVLKFHCPVTIEESKLN